MHHSETYVIDIEVIASVLLILRSLLKSVIDVEVIVGCDPEPLWSSSSSIFKTFNGF
uniref:Uncharacterized protein n=1 Tax=Solanum tuberosum TaxID=4113 RepID=M1DE09_SOLTU